MSRAKNAIRSTSDLPKEFSLNKYDGLKNLGYSGWYMQLRLRQRSGPTYLNNQARFDKWMALHGQAALGEDSALK